MPQELKKICWKKLKWPVHGITYAPALQVSFWKENSHLICQNFKYIKFISEKYKLGYTNVQYSLSAKGYMVNSLVNA